MNVPSTQRVRSPLIQIINSVMLTIIAIFLGYLTNSISTIRDQQETINIAIAVMNQRIEDSNRSISAYKITVEDRLSNLENGSISVVSDRISKTEALEAIDNLREWVEKYYERKH